MTLVTGARPLYRAARDLYCRVVRTYPTQQLGSRPLWHLQLVHTLDQQTSGWGLKMSMPKTKFNVQSEDDLMSSTVCTIVANHRGSNRTKEGVHIWSYHCEPQGSIMQGRVVTIFIQ